MPDIADTDLGLRIIYSPEHVDEEHLINIIAIHGIGAHPRKTWTKKVFTDGVLLREHNWLIDPHMLPKEVPNIRVWTYGYHSAWFGIDAVNTSLTGISKRLLSALEREKLTKQPLIFVAHCFGGLVVLKTLLLAEDRPDNNSPPLDLFKYTYGIVFFATPFQGTNRQFAERLIRGARKVESVVLEDRWLLDILRKGNDTLGELKEGFLRKITLYKRPQVACISEEKVSDIGGIIKSIGIYSLVVDNDSACLATRLDKPTITSRPRARDHFNVSKFTSDTDEDYRFVAEKLKEFASDASDAMPAVDRQVIGKQITALQNQSNLPPHVPMFDPAGWMETPFQLFPTDYKIEKKKIVVPWLASYYIVGLSPDCTLILLLKPQLARIFRHQADLEKPVLELKPPQSRFPFEKGTLGDHVLAITTQYGCSLWDLDSPSREAKKTIPYPPEDNWHLDCVAIHEGNGLVMVAIGIWRRAERNFRCGRVDLYVLDKDNLDTEQQMRMSADFLDSPKLLNFASNGSLLICSTSERNRILVWNLDGPSGMEPMSQTARDFTGGSDGITSALIWLSPGGKPYMLCTTSPRAQRAKHDGEWTFLAPAGDPFPEHASHCLHYFHHVQRRKHYTLHACAVPPQGNIVALLDKTGKLCLVPLQADSRGGITSEVRKDPIEIKGWNLDENNYRMVAMRFDPKGKRLFGVNSHGVIRVLHFSGQSAPSATPLLMGPGMSSLSRAQTSVAPSGHFKTGSWSTMDGKDSFASGS